MKTKYFFLAAIGAMTLASCSNDELVGDNSPTLGQEGDGSIQFTYTMPNATRADIGGGEAAKLLGKNFYVMGTKGTEAGTSPSPTLVFDNYLVNFKDNTAGTTESNTANWEYVGIVPGTTTGCTDKVKLGTYTAQTIKYWDYSASQYDFFAFSVGPNASVKTTPTSNQIGVTAMLHGTDLAGATAYTLTIPSVDDLKETYITDIKKVVGTSEYGKEVQLQFKNVGAKIRVALYETVPGYSVKDVKFYSSETATIVATTDPSYSTTVSGNAILINAAATGFTSAGSIEVKFPYMGTSNSSAQAYNKADAVVTPTDGEKTQEFGPLTSQYVSGQDAEEGFDAYGVKKPTSSIYLGRTLPTASFAGIAAESFYQPVFPTASTSNALTLRVDYTLVSTDGSKEEIHVYGANAVVPSTYTQWKPNYAYTYVFKISDNTNGWTNVAQTAKGLFPITFDAVVTEFTDVTGEQTTITTVAAPTITTYQQNHNPNTDGTFTPADEYKNDGKDIYVQVMDNTGSAPATLKGDLNGTTPTNGTARSLLYKVTSSKTYDTQPAGWPDGYYTDAICKTAAVGFTSGETYHKRCTEADVMDALLNRTTALTDLDVTGRNGVVLTNSDKITTSDDGAESGEFRIQNGVDNNPIVVNEGQAAQIKIGTLEGIYAYVYDYTTAVGGKTTTTIYQPTGQTTGAIASTVKYVTADILNTLTGSGYITTGAETSTDGTFYNFVYFSKTTNGTGTTTYSYVSIDGKETLPAGLIKCPLNKFLTGDGVVTADANTFVFNTYTRNDGKYAVKVIKVVD